MATVTEWSEAQRAVLAHEAGALLVLGAAGTGKTALVVEKVASRLRAGEPEALVLCLSRQASSEVRDRVIRSSGRTSRQPAVMTLHSFCLALLEHWGDVGEPLPRLLTAPEQEFRIRELLAGRGARLWPEELRAAAGTRAFAAQVRAALARARQLGLDPLDVAEAGARAGEPGWVALGEFMEEYLDVLDAEGTLDYAELVHRARLLLERPGVLEVVRRRYGAVYVDELAELDPAQLALVRALVPDGGQAIGFADPDTAIFRFRGAHPRAAAAFAELFGAETVVLDAGFRQGPALAAASGRVAARLGTAAVDAGAMVAMRGAAPAASGGGVSVCTFPDEAAQAHYIAGELRSAHLDGGVPWADMAVLVRSGRGQLAGLSRALTDAGIPVEVAGDEVGLASELAVRPLLLGLQIVGRGGVCDADEAHRLLTSGWGGLNAVGMRRLGRALRAASDAGEVRGVPSGDLIARVLSGASELPEAPPGDAGVAELYEVVGGRRDALASGLAAAEKGLRPDEVLWRLWSGVGWPDALKAAALRGGDAAPRAHRDLDAVVALFSLAAESQAPPGQAGIRAFLAEVAAQQIPADVQREASVSGRGVRILTAHRAKGQQWRMVVLAGAQEGVWPDVTRRGSLFDPQRLTNAGLGAGVETRELVANERRLFLLAATRASERLLVTAVAGTEGEADQPSRFLGELGVPARHVTVAPVRLHTLRALVASLRATAQNPEATPELREAAAVRLARLADEADDDGRPLAPEADPARWWGMRPLTGDVAVRLGDRLVLSPSQLASVLACPRQYFLSREAKADPPRGSGALLGSVIHALAEHALADGLDREQALEYLDRVWSDIPFPAPWFSASERVEAEAAVERFMVWQGAHDYAEVLGVEVPFSATVEVDGEPVVVRGSVDRLEREASGGLRVVDFKSSRSLPTKAEAASQDQVGLYQVAIEAGAFGEVAPGAAGSAGGALVYLRHGDDTGYPKVLGQPSLREQPHLSDDPDELAYPTWVHHRLASARRILTEGRFDATPGDACRFCAFASSCPAKSAQVIA